MEEKQNKPTPLWELRMSPLQQKLGWCYLPMHALILPALVMLYTEFGGSIASEVAVNIAYYALGIVVLAAVFLPYLRREFDILLDRLFFCVRTMIGGFFIMYALTSAATALLLLFESVLQNPNDAQAMEMMKENFGVVKGLSVFVAPIVEEVLFRGVLFGSLRKRGRGKAYIISALVFGLYHVWQSAALSGDWTLLLYAVQYLPVAVVLNWCYERSGTLWTSIFYHIIYNAAAFSLLQEVL